MSKQAMLAVSGAAILLIVALTFLPNARNALVCYDDYDYIVANRAIADGLTPRAAYWSFRAAGYAGNWHPLTWLSHAFDYTIAHNLRWELEDGSCPFSTFIHCENILLHSLNALLLWLLILFLLAPPGKLLSPDSYSRSSILLALFFTLLWAVHPLRVEVVAWAAERKELLSVLFMLLTLVLYVNEQVDRRYPVATFVLALLAKPVAVSLPAVLFAYDYILRGRTFRDALKNAVPYAGLSAATCYLTMLSQKVALETGEMWSWGTRIRCAIEAPIVYLVQTLYPARLCFDYPFPDDSTWPHFALGIVLLLAMAAVGLAGLLRRRCRLAAFLIAWSYIGLIPMIGIVKVGYEPHSDRYTYWIGCGVACCAALALVRFKSVLQRHIRLLAVGGGLLFLVLSALSVRQSRVWRDNTAILTDITEKTHNEDAVRSLCELMILKDGEDANAQAEALLRETLRIRQSPLARAALAIHLLGYGTDVKPTDEVRQLVAQVRQEAPENGWNRVAQAFIAFHEKRYADAVADMRYAQSRGYQSLLVKVDLKDWECLAEANGSR